MILANILLIINPSWVENKKACDHLIELCPNIEAIIKLWNKLPKLKQPLSKSYMAVKDGVDDELFTAKLSFYSFVASLVELFLKKDQCDKPMIPFMYADLKSLIQSLLELVVEKDILSQCKTGIQMKLLDLCNKENLLNSKDINLGFAVPNIIAKLRRNATVTLAELKEFKGGTQKFIIGMMVKLFERSPLDSIFLRYASIFDPSVLFEFERNLLTKCMKSLLKFMIELSIMEPS